MKSNTWFEVDKAGLAALQLRKPKHYVLRELLQNALDENITTCEITAQYYRNICTLSVFDDSPDGFKDIKDSFTLFKHTDKRRNPNQRGRFNSGEKQAISICNSAEISTTTGTVIFDKTGRHMKRRKTQCGSIIILKLKITLEEFKNLCNEVKLYLIPEHIKCYFNGIILPYKKPFKIINAPLKTEYEIDGQIKSTIRKTDIHILKSDKSHLFEMGLPIIEIDCPYSIDVQQKIPLSVDRDSVKQSYLKDLFAIVLNETVDEIENDNSSETWIRIGSGDKKITSETMEKIIEKRFGDKVVVANPNDPISNDDAISKGYRVIRGNELSKEEWANIKKNNLIKSSTQVFGSSFATDTKPYTPNNNMLLVEELAKRIAEKFLNKTIEVRFYTSKQVSAAASYGNRILSFNVFKLGKRFFDNPLSKKVLSLIIHELGHENGLHTQMSYHELLTDLAGDLIVEALENPSFFILNELKSKNGKNNE